MAVLSKKRAAMVQKLDELINRMRRLFLNTYAEALMNLRTQIENGADFSWKDNPVAEKKIDKLIQILENKSNIIINNGITQYQQYGTQSALDALRERARQIAAKYGNQKFINRGATDEIKALNKEATNQRRIDAVDGHSRTIANRGGGMNNLSNRVWNLNDQVKKELEIIVQDSIKKGYSVEYAIKLAKEYLNNPAAMDGWKKDKDGNWYQTPAAKDYHPGRGVYKSAEKNIERMIRTETMAAYRTAEIEQYQKNPMVKGYRIQLSSNHTTTDGKGGVKKLKDICDRLQGDYPKTFVWTGWHPNCRCVLIPIMLTDDEFAEYLKAKRDGKLDEFSQKTNIQDFPENMTEWMDENEPRIQEVIDNPKKELPVWVDSVMKESGMSKNIVVNNKVEITINKSRSVSDLDAISDIKEKIDVIKDFMSDYYDEKYGNYQKTNQQKEKTIQSWMNEGLGKAMEWIKGKYSNTLTYIARMKVLNKYSEINNININSIRPEWRIEFNKVLKIINKTEDENTKFRMLAYADNIIEWSKVSNINTDEVCLMFPVSLYKKFKSDFFIRNITDFFRKQKTYIPHFDLDDKCTSFFSQNRHFVKIWTQDPSYSNEEGLANVIYHEFGHADDWARNLRRNKNIIKAFDKWAKKFKKVKFEDLNKWFSDFQTKNEINNLKSNNLASFSDMIQALQGSDKYVYGGHKKGYYKKKNMRIAEFIAHLSEFNYQSNSVIYQYNEDLFNDLKKLCNKIYPDE